MRIPAVLALATLCTTLALQPAAAQPADAPPAPTPDVGATSLTIGYFNVAFDYASPQNGYAYGFDGPATTLMLSGDAAALSFAWGTTADGVASADSAAPSHQMIDAALISGGNATLVRLPEPLPLQVFVPIRLHLGYRRLSVSATDDAGDPIPALNLANAGIGLGGGARLRVPTSLPVVQDHLVVLGALVIAYGGMMQVGGDGLNFEQVHLARTTDLTLEARLEKLLGATGLTVGYTFRTTSWNDDYIAGLDETIDALSDLDTFSQRSRQHLLRIGLNW